MKRRMLLGVCLAIGAWGLCCSFDSAEIASSAVQSSSEAVSVSEEASESDESVESASAVSSEAGKITLADEDGDGIPDVMEDYYNEHIRDQYLFGISLGALITAGISFLFDAVKLKMSTKSNKLVADRQEASNSSISLNAIQIRSLQESVKVLSKKIEDSDKENKEQLEATRKELAEATEQLKAYSQFGVKVDTILLNQEAMTRTADYTKSGVAQEVSSNNEEASTNGKE